MVRNYLDATITFEKVIARTGASKSIRKKIIVCYVRLFQMEKAIDEFLSLIREDINFIINTNLQDEDCPCPEIISEIGSNKINFSNKEKKIALGILWLYCDLDTSLRYFEEYNKEYGQDNKINEIISIIKTFKNQTTQEKK
jgi:hypothetical protein